MQSVQLQKHGMNTAVRNQNNSIVACSLAGGCLVPAMARTGASIELPTPGRTSHVLRVRMHSTTKDALLVAPGRTVQVCARGTLARTRRSEDTVLHV